MKSLDKNFLLLIVIELKKKLEIFRQNFLPNQQTLQQFFVYGFENSSIFLFTILTESSLRSIEVLPIYQIGTYVLFAMQILSNIVLMVICHRSHSPALASMATCRISAASTQRGTTLFIWKLKTYDQTINMYCSIWVF